MIEDQNKEPDIQFNEICEQEEPEFSDGFPTESYNYENNQKDKSRSVK